MLQKKFTSALHSKLNTKLPLFLIALFGLVLRLAFFSGIGTSDDLAYTRYAVNIDRGIDPHSVMTLSTRLGMIYPTAFSYSLFGISDFSSVLFVLLTSVGSIILIFYFGKLLFNEKTGLMAAFLLSSFPLDMVYATKLLSDLPSAFFMALGVYLFLYSEIKQKLKYGMGYLFAGISIGIGYLIRESVLLIALFFIIYILYKKRLRKEYFLVPLGILIIFAIETLIFFTLTSDPLFRMHASQQYLIDAVIAYNYFGRLDFPTGLFHYPYMILTNNLLSYFYVFIFIAIAYCLIRKKEETYTLLFWFIPLLLYLSFGSSSLTRYIPFKAADRYLLIIAIPGILLLAFFLSEKRRFIKRVVMPAALVILLLTSVISVYLREDRSLLGNLNGISSYLEGLDMPVYTDDRTVQALDYIQKYRNGIEVREYPDDLRIIKDAYVLVNKYMINRLKEAHKDIEFPEEIDNPPESWKITKEIGEGENKIIIYYAS